MKNRYLAFGGDSYYPRGGWDDFLGGSDALALAEAYCCESNGSGGIPRDWAHVVDGETWRIVSEFAGGQRVDMGEDAEHGRLPK